MEAAEDAWKEAKHQANNQALILGKQKQPLLASRNVKILGERRDQLEKTQTALDKQIGLAIKREGGQESGTGRTQGQAVGNVPEPVPDAGRRTL